jgi:hypothetical protein
MLEEGSGRVGRVFVGFGRFVMVEDVLRWRKFVGTRMRNFAGE